MPTDTQNQIANVITEKDLEQQERKVEILNRAQQKLKSLEEEVEDLDGYLHDLQEESEKAGNNIQRLTVLKAAVDRNILDAQATRRANLKSIDSLRQDGIQVDLRK
jgi:hypothetical protein